jgi:hypothetical protein
MFGEPPEDPIAFVSHCDVTEPQFDLGDLLLGSS